MCVCVHACTHTLDVVEDELPDIVFVVESEELQLKQSEQLLIQSCVCACVHVCVHVSVHVCVFVTLSVKLSSL